MTDLATSHRFLESCVRYLILGIVQGLTEFLPISSTAHLKVVPTLFGWGDPGISITASLQLGSIIAVIAYFKSDLQSVIKGISRAIQFGNWKEPEAQLALAIGIGTLPILLAGMAIKLFWSGYEQSPFRSIPGIAFVSIVMAFALFMAERISPRKKSLPSVRGIDGLLVGIGQILALIPGVSRSGITLTTALLNGWKRQDAARFSFLLGIPAITLAGLGELKNAFEGPHLSEVIPLLLGVTTAALVSWVSIDWLLKYLQRNNTWIFVIYRLLFGGALLFWHYLIPAKS